LRLLLPAVPVLGLALIAAVPLAHAQNNYEIQVYGAETVAPRATMLELHSNFTADGQRNVVDGVEPTNHAEHETIEITQGIWGDLQSYKARVEEWPGYPFARR
jgi:hypothetical protein